jgi:hypothetical protein
MHGTFTISECQSRMDIVVSAIRDAELDNPKATEVIQDPHYSHSHPLLESYAHLRSLRRFLTPSSLGVLCPDLDNLSLTESSMEERDVQNLPQGSSGPYTAVGCISFGENIDIPQIGHSDPQLRNNFPNNFFHPPCNQV